MSFRSNLRVFLASLALVSCSAAPVLAAADYWPLGIGYRSTYATGDETATVEISATRVVNSTTTFVVDYDVAGWKYSDSMAGSDGAAMLYQRCSDSCYTYPTPQMKIPSGTGLQVGYAWSYLEEPGVTVDASVVSLNEARTTTAGVFTNCLKLRITWHGWPGFYGYRWYARGVGLVALENWQQGAGSPYGWWNLTSYQVPEPSTIVYAKPGAPAGGDGTTWEKAFSNLQVAVDAAARTGGQVWAARGTFYGSIEMKEGVRLYGGFAGTETELSQRNYNTNQTVINATGYATGVTAANASTLDGLVIKGGTYGIFCGTRSPTIANCVVRENSTGLYASNGCTASVSDCSFVDNIYYGVYCHIGAAPTIESCDISRNSSGVYCYAASPSISECSINSNRNYGLLCDHYASPQVVSSEMKSNGTGVYCFTRSSPSLSDCRIQGNAWYGLRCDKESSPTVQSCVISNNTRLAVYFYLKSNAVVVNSIIASNGGRGILCDQSSPMIVNCTIAKNADSAIYSLSSTPRLVNCIIAGNRGTGGALRSNGVLGPQVSYCCLYANGPTPFDRVASPVGSEGNFAANPVFVSTAAGDFRLRTNSPCVSAGTRQAAYVPDTDIIGAARGTAAVSMGAYESPVQARIVYVRQGAAAGGDGTSWAKAYFDIVRAVNDAATTGGQVWVGKGNYYGSVTLQEGVELYGGFAGTETSISARRIADNPSVIDATGRPQAITAADFSGVDGFTLRKGSYGVRCNDKSVSIANCNITQNLTGVYIGRGSAAEVRLCTVNSNTYYGIYCDAGSDAAIAYSYINGNVNGGVYCFASSPRIVGCEMANNAKYGLLADCGSSPTVSGCSILDNSTGIYCYLSSSPRISDCVILRSKWYGLRCDVRSSPVVESTTIAAGQRLGVYCYSSSNPTLSSCIISGNATHGVLSEYSSPNIVNCTIANNTGCGVLTVSGRPTVRNSIVSRNWGEPGGAITVQGTLIPIVANCVFWDNGGNQFAGMASPIGSNYNLNADPLFTNAAGGDYVPLAGSPCIDAGNSSAPGLSPRDALGNPRIVRTVDIGAIEVQEYRILRGRVVGSENQSVGLADITVTFGRSPILTAVTDANGYFEINLGMGSSVLSYYPTPPYTFSINTINAPDKYKPPAQVWYENGRREQDELPIPNSVLTGASTDLGLIIVIYYDPSGPPPPPPPPPG